MSEIKDYSDAEREFKKWLEYKYPKAKDLRLIKVWKDDNQWILEGDLKLATGLFSYDWKIFRFKMTSHGEITGYEFLSKSK